eukprot:scaffold140451_cov208-Phaeocystis_antarctica.AAC.1
MDARASTVTRITCRCTTPLWRSSGGSSYCKNSMSSSQRRQMARHGPPPWLRLSPLRTAITLYGQPAGKGASSATKPP